MTRWNVETSKVETNKRCPSEKIMFQNLFPQLCVYFKYDWIELMMLVRCDVRRKNAVSPLPPPSASLFFFHVRRLKRIVSVNRIPPTRVLLLIDTELVSISLSVCIIQTALASKYITNTLENVDTFPKYLRESFKVKTIIVSLLVALMKSLPHFKH